MSKSDTNGKVASAAGPPRRCHVVKVEDFDGYGFNLHAEKGKPGQYIGKVDDASPAERAGLRQGDRIIEVNGVNIGRETHKEVVQRIKAIANEVQLLVVDPNVAVTKDNRIVDQTPVNGVGKTNGSSSEQEKSSLITPDIVVQVPSTPSTPKENNSHSSGSTIGHDQTDHVAATHNSSVPSSPITPDKQRSAANSDHDEIVAIKVVTDNVSPISINTSKTSTFSTSPKDHSPTYNNTFISTASIRTSEEIHVEEEEVKVVSNVNVIQPKSPSSTTTRSTPSSSPLLSKSEIANIPLVTSASAVPPSEEPPRATTPAPSTPTATKAAADSATTITSSALTNGSVASAQQPPPPSVTSNQSQTANGSANTTTTTNSSGLNLNMTVAELRAKLAAKKKFDPKADQVDVRKKYEIVEKL